MRKADTLCLASNDKLDRVRHVQTHCVSQRLVNMCTAEDGSIIDSLTHGTGLETYHMLL